MTMRFTSGESHFGFLLVDLARFISAVSVAGRSTAPSGDANRPFGAKLTSNRGCSIHLASSPSLIASLMIRRSAVYPMQEIYIADG